MTTSPISHMRGVCWHRPSRLWHVRIQRDPYRGSYGYYQDHDEAVAVAEAAYAGLIELPRKPRPRGPARQPMYGPTRRDAPKIKVAPSNSTSGVRGVSWNSKLGKWHVRIIVKGERYSFGVYADLAEATAVAQEVYAGTRTPKVRRSRALGIA